jgi:hypothetical protein
MSHGRDGTEDNTPTGRKNKTNKHVCKPTQHTHTHTCVSQTKVHQSAAWRRSHDLQWEVQPHYKAARSTFCLLCTAKIYTERREGKQNRRSPTINQKGFAWGEVLFSGLRKSRALDWLAYRLPDSLEKQIEEGPCRQKATILGSVFASSVTSTSTTTTVRSPGLYDFFRSERHQLPRVFGWSGMMYTDAVVAPTTRTS